MAVKTQNFVILFLMSFFGVTSLHAQTQKFAVYKAKVINSNAAVYSKPDFDSPVIGYVNSGKEYEISSKVFSGAFYRIKVKENLIGFIADSDVVPVNFATKTVKTNAGKIRTVKQQDPAKQNRPFSLTRFVGFEYGVFNFREETMGIKPTAQLGFYGIKFTGPNVIVEGDMVTEAHFLFHPGAPKYYEAATTKAADGWILLADILFLSVYPQTKNTQTYFGFGPMLKYSKFNVQLDVGSSTKNYSMDDINFGAAFNLGLGLRLGSWAARCEIKYYWEQIHYYGLGVAVQMPF
jgi:hypothetical protein